MERVILLVGALRKHAGVDTLRKYASGIFLVSISAAMPPQHLSWFAPHHLLASDRGGYAAAASILVLKALSCTDRAGRVARPYEISTGSPYTREILRQLSHPR